MRIVLWDIDGTLVSTGGAGERALQLAVAHSGTALARLSNMHLGGMTDPLIARELKAAELGVAPEAVTREDIDGLLEAYLRGLAVMLPASPAYRVLPGIVGALDMLEAFGCTHALGTGNVEDGARLKLSHGGIWERFRFGGYGSDAEIRAELIRAAIHKSAAALDRVPHTHEFVVVGDTVRDIDAAHANGLPCVAVASGRVDAATLRNAGAERVFETMEDPDAIAAILEVRFAG